MLVRGDLLVAFMFQAFWGKGKMSRYSAELFVDDEMRSTGEPTSAVQHYACRFTSEVPKHRTLCNQRHKKCPRMFRCAGGSQFPVQPQLLQYLADNPELGICATSDLKGKSIALNNRACGAC